MAIAYDFDGTLAHGNMQEHSFIPQLEIDKDEFWKEVNVIAKDNDMDQILAYMYLMLDKATKKKVRVKKEDFNMHGRDVEFFDGVEKWFDNINEYAKNKQINIEHYVISSGLREMIEGTSIYKKFEHVFASGYKYDHHGIAEYPALAINYTTKTQYLFRINKGIKNSWENSKINEYIPDNKRAIPFKHMIYIGDGDTDIPAMKMVNYQGGKSIAVYKKNAKKKYTHKAAKKLVEEGRATICAEANYLPNSDLDKSVKGMIDQITVDIMLNKMK